MSASAQAATSGVNPPDRCLLEHPVFATFRDVAFRPAESDGTPVMVFALGGSTAALTLRSLQAEFQIDADSPDGRTLALVARALGFVNELRPGDPFPLEVLGAGASWQPGAAHKRLAEDRLRLLLVAANEPGPHPPWAVADPAAVLDAAAEPGFDTRLRHAAATAAQATGAPDADAALQRLVAAAHEFAFIEALRDRLLRRVAAMLARLDGLAGALGHNPGAIELLSRVRRLAAIGVARLRTRFTEVESSLADLHAVLRDLDGFRSLVQRHRDWLYGSLRAWEEILTGWETGGADWSAETWALLRRSYRFLAPRFMPIQEWQPGAAAYRAARTPRTPMVW